MQSNNNKYNDILNMPHHVSKKHPQMTIDARAAQFAPFAALTGYEDAIVETARLTSERIELNEEQISIINRKINIIKENIKTTPKLSITYFIPDYRKEGGEYIKIIGNVKKIDEYSKKIVFEDNKEIRINDILDISGDIINNYENM